MRFLFLEIIKCKNVWQNLSQVNFRIHTHTTSVRTCKNVCNEKKLKFAKTKTMNKFMGEESLDEMYTQNRDVAQW
jgi:hypothetical protein